MTNSFEFEFISFMDGLLKAEREATIGYFKKNWSQVFSFTALGLVFYCLLTFRKLNVDSWIEVIRNSFPPVILVLTVEWLLLIVLTKKTASLKEVMGKGRLDLLK